MAIVDTDSALPERTAPAPDPEEAAGLLLRDLRTTPQGLSAEEVRRRLLQYGPNRLSRHTARRWPPELLAQLTHPLALLLWVAGGLSLAVGNTTVAVAVLLVIVLNAGFALVQELEAERAVEALARYLPERTRVMRGGREQEVDVEGLVPGDLVLLGEGDRVPADVRLLEGTLEVDVSTLTGESAPVLRAAELADRAVPRLSARELVFMGSSCTEGAARGVVFATGMHTELGRIASLSQRVRVARSPLEQQVRRVAWLIAGVAVLMAVAFVPLSALVAGLSVRNAVVFAVGLLAGNVPEGLLPVITLALAVEVRALARRGAVVKRLSAVETLGCTDVICTDKTGTLTENRMRPVALWTPGEVVELADLPSAGAPGAATATLLEAAVTCSNARITPEGATGDPTEVGLLLAADRLGLSAERDPAARECQLHFEPHLKLMSTVDRRAAERWLHTKGAPEEVLARCSAVADATGAPLRLEPAVRESISRQIETFGRRGMRVIAVARRQLDEGPLPAREDLERDLTLLGLVALEDPPRAEVSEAVARCHSAGIRVVVITGDHPTTASAIARRVGIGGPAGPRTVLAEEFDVLPDHELRDLLARDEEIVFARATPEAKLRIADALRQLGHVVAMTGDGVNDAPALRRADIGVAMGRSGTDVAREAATMVLADDDFASVVAAVEAGRRVYDNVRKFIVYIFAHAIPEIVPFLVFALSGGLIPLPLTVLQLLAFDVGSETLPSLALGRDPAEPGAMQQPPRPVGEGVIRPPMLLRAWLFLGPIVAALQLGGFFLVLAAAGWHPGAPVGPGHPLHHAYLEATTMSFAGMIAGQIGTAFAVRTRLASLRSVGALSNRPLLAAVAGVVLFAALFVYVAPLGGLIGTTALPVRDVLLLVPYPFVVWGADELRRWILRRRVRTAGARLSPAAP